MGLKKSFLAMFILSMVNMNPSHANLREYNPTPRLAQNIDNAPLCEGNLRVRIYSASWCGPCHLLHLFLNAATASSTLSQNIHYMFMQRGTSSNGSQTCFLPVETMDASTNPGVTIVPTIQILHEGRVVATHDGVLSPEGWNGFLNIIPRFQTTLLLPGWALRFQHALMAERAQTQAQQPPQTQRSRSRQHGSRLSSPRSVGPIDVDGAVDSAH